MSKPIVPYSAEDAALFRDAMQKGAKMSLARVDVHENAAKALSPDDAERARGYAEIARRWATFQEELAQEYAELALPPQLHLIEEDGIETPSCGIPGCGGCTSS